MNNPAINQVLAELQDSLKTIESARTQVNEVTVKSEQIIHSFNDVLKSIGSIGDQIGIDDEYIKESVDEKFKVLENEIKLIVGNLKESISIAKGQLIQEKLSFTQSLENNLLTTQDELKTFTANSQSNLKNINAEFTEQKSLFSENITKSFNQYKEELDSSVQKIESIIKESNDDFSSHKNDFKQKLDTTVENLSAEFIHIVPKIQRKTEELNTELSRISSDFNNVISGVNVNLRNFEEKLKEAENKIEKLDFDASFKAIYQHIDKKQKVNIILISVCTAMIIATIVFLR